MLLLWSNMTRHLKKTVCTSVSQSGYSLNLSDRVSVLWPCFLSRCHDFRHVLKTDYPTFILVIGDDSLASLLSSYGKWLQFYQSLWFKSWSFSCHFCFMSKVLKVQTVHEELEWRNNPYIHTMKEMVVKQSEGKISSLCG